jgi:hypothetical protein
MFILLTIGLFLAKFLAVGVVGLFFAEDLELTSSVGGTIYSAYMALGIGTFFSLLFFVLGRKFLWLILTLVLGASYLSMYNGADGIKEVHQENDLKSRYFKDTSTFLSRMEDVAKLLNKSTDD